MAEEPHVVEVDPVVERAARRGGPRPQVIHGGEELHGWDGHRPTKEADRRSQEDSFAGLVQQQQEEATAREQRSKPQAQQKLLLSRACQVSECAAFLLFRLRACWTWRGKLYTSEGLWEKSFVRGTATTMPWEARW